MLVSLIAAVTEDGLIAKTKNHRSTVWTSDQDRQFFVKHVKQADALIIGRATFATMKKFAKGSSWWVYTSRPETFVNPKPTVIEAKACNLTPLALIKKLQKQGKKRILICGGASIYTQFVEAGLVNRLLLTVEPVRFGEGVKLFTQPVNVQYRLKRTIKLSGESIVYEYQN